MLNLRKIDRLASELEAQLGITAEESLQQKIEERTKEEKEEVALPTPSVEACNAKEEAGARIAHLKRLIKLAKAVKKSKKLSAEEKEEALNEIKKSSKKNKKANDDLIIRRNDFNKMLNNDVTKIMKTPGKLNKMLQNEKGITLRELIGEMEKMGDSQDFDVAFPTNILGKNIGNCDVNWLVKLGPMIATLIEKYNKHISNFDDFDNFNDFDK